MALGGGKLGLNRGQRAARTGIVGFGGSQRGLPRGQQRLQFDQAVFGFELRGLGGAFARRDKPVPAAQTPGTRYQPFARRQRATIIEVGHAHQRQPRQQFVGRGADMVRQRGSGVTAAAVAVKASFVATRGERAAGAKKKLSFKDKHALETLPKRMDQLTSEIAKQRRILDDPRLYARDRPGF